MMKKQKIAVVPGSYDPVTKGHLFLIEYAATHYETVYVTAFVNPEKRYLFSLSERLEMLKIVCAPYKNVTVDSYCGMQVDYAKEKGIAVCVRGYRNEQDRLYEEEIAAYNSEHLPSYRTVLLPCPSSMKKISSTAVREKLARNDSLFELVPPEIAKYLLHRNE